MLLDRARWGLALAWFPASALLFVLLMAFSLFHQDLLAERQRFWGWGLPSFLPTLMLMISVFAADALVNTSSSTVRVRKNFYQLALGLSIFYHLVLLAILLVMPASVAARDGAVLIEEYEETSIFLGPLQGLVAAALGVLFFSKE